MNNINILWADDEIDVLKPQIIFLEHKGYTVVPVTNGTDAVNYCRQHSDVDVVFLDESMPGMSGLDALTAIKNERPGLPVVMITKNEAEDLMEEAIGAQITDYLIKPVKPNQILLTLKKLLDNKRLVQQKTNADYQREFQQISMNIQSQPDFKGWCDIYKQLVFWELELDKSPAGGMREVLGMQKQEANTEFSKFVAKN